MSSNTIVFTFLNYKQKSSEMKGIFFKTSTDLFLRVQSYRVHVNRRLFFTFNMSKNKWNKIKASTAIKKTYCHIKILSKKVSMWK